MNNRTFKFMMAGMSTATWVMVGAGVIAGYLNYAQYEPAFESVNPEHHSVEMQGTRHILIRREFRIHREREFRFIRELVRSMDGKVIRIELPSSVVTYPPDIYMTERTVEIPPLKSGTYVAVNRVCWKPNILRNECVNLPRLELVVP
jgi:hypothetical protein